MKNIKKSWDIGMEGDKSSDSSSEDRFSADILSSSCFNILQATVQAMDPFDDPLDFDNATVNGKEGVEDAKPIETANFFKLSLTIVSGTDLIPMDRNKKSDPYVKVKMNNELIMKTEVREKTLAPVWDESCEVIIDKRGTLLVEVYDKDLVGKDFLGQAELDLESCELETNNEVSLSLTDGGDQYLRKFKGLGSIVVGVNLLPLFHREDDRSIFGTEVESSSPEGKLRMCDFFKSTVDLTKNQMNRDAVVHVNLIESQSLVSSDSKNDLDLFCKLTLGNETFKSKSKNAQWYQTFDFSWILKKGTNLVIELYSQDTFMTENFLGKVSVDLRWLTPEVSHNVGMTVEDGSRDISFVVTISGVSSTTFLPLLREEHSAGEDLMAKYGWKNTFSNIRDVGHLSVKVVRAEGLHSADWFSKSDPYCVLKLENTRLRTETKFETLEPVWEKDFSFEITDINEVFELTVYDEDAKQKGEFLGKIRCSLMKIQNGAAWFSLKDETLLKKAKGKDPKILLDMNLQWNPVRAAVQTLRQPKVEKKEPDTKLTIYKMCFTITENITRMKSALPELDDGIVKEIESILSWNKMIKSSFAYLVSLAGIWIFDLWMIPLCLLALFIPPLISRIRFGEEKKALKESRRNLDKESPDDSGNETSSGKSDTDSGNPEVEDDDEEKSLTETARMIHDWTEFFAHTLESIENVFNFTVPLLSWIGVVMLLILTFLLYLTPFRVLLMFLVTKVFFRKYSDGKSLGNFISKVPDKRQLKQLHNDPVAERSDVCMTPGAL